jgi:hypothetical protein
MVGQVPGQGDALTPRPSLTLPALRQAVATVAPGRLPEMFTKMQEAFVLAGERGSVTPIQMFYREWAVIVRWRPGVAGGRAGPCYFITNRFRGRMKYESAIIGAAHRRPDPGPVGPGDTQATRGRRVRTDDHRAPRLRAWERMPVLQWLLDLVGDPESSKWISQARRRSASSGTR